ncbi:MAG TPA: hypothetical protein VKZ53_13110 [Candidatus Angelobacter sp.]|nr:hypothetical protein [Candidatus Angelobacter sp.]
MSGEDFVDVQLSEFGAKWSGGTLVRVHDGRHEFSFAPGQTQRVTKAFDWLRVLSIQMIDGHPLFEIAPKPQPPIEKIAPTKAQKRESDSQ